LASLVERLRALLRPAGPTVQRAEVSGDRNVVVQIVGDGNTVVPGYAYLSLTRYLNRRVLPGQGEPLGEAAALLSPYAFSVPLVGREKVLADLWAWMRNGRPISIRVMTARAGTGKTRLALELCEQAVREGWDAGFLPDGELVRFRAAQNASTWGWRRPSLVVVDYAASRVEPLREWLIELADHAGYKGKPLRLLLLERHADPSSGWWREVFGVGGGDAEAVAQLLNPPAGPFELPPLVAPEERRQVLVEILKRVGSSVRPPDLATKPGFAERLGEITWGGEPLFLLMAGLVASRAGFGEVLALSATELGFQIAGHEVHRIHAIARAHQIPEELLGHLAAFVTLCQGLGQAEVEGLVEEEARGLGFRADGGPLPVYKALAAALPGEQGAVAPVLPDVVGEAVILEALGGRMEEKALESISRAARQARERVTASLIHLAQDYGSVRHEPIRWFERLAAESAVDLALLETLLRQLPESTLALRETAAALAERAVALAREQEARELLSRLLNVLSSRLSALGRLEAALATIEEAVNLNRELASSLPDAFRPDLASSLNNLSNRLGELGRLESALEASEEAVELYRELAASRPHSFQLDLGKAFNNLAVYLSAVGRREAALAASGEAVELYGELTASQPDTFRPVLAGALTTLSACLSDLGKRKEALVASAEAVNLNRELAASRPDAFRPQLAISLNSLSLNLSALGMQEAALAAIEEAVVIDRGLAETRPDAFRRNLARSLNNLALRLSDLGRRKAALAAIEQAVELYRELATSRPDAFRPSLAMSLNNLARSLNDLGMLEAALPASEEAINLYRELATSRPDAFRPDVALSLNNVSIYLSGLGMREEALAAIEEAVLIRRELAASRPDAFLTDLAGSLGNLSQCLSALRKPDAAHYAIEEAVLILAPYFFSHPAAFKPWMRNMVTDYLRAAEEAGREPDLQLLASIQRLL
jgi:tetratricopeptide (TPR) repeat protein